MPSRNSKLTVPQRADAAVLLQALLAARRRFEEGERDAGTLRAAIKT